MAKNMSHVFSCTCRKENDTSHKNKNKEFTLQEKLENHRLKSGGDCRGYVMRMFPGG